MLNYLDFLSLVLKRQLDPKQVYTTSADDEHKPSPLEAILVSTLTWKELKTGLGTPIRRYREMFTLHPECDMAIEDIVNEASRKIMN